MVEATENKALEEFQAHLPAPRVVVSNPLA